MLNLFSLPDWLIVLPAIVFVRVLFAQTVNNKKWVPLLIPMIAFDQLGVAVGGILLEPIKIAIVILGFYFLLKQRLPRLAIAPAAFLLWLIVRDALALATVTENFGLATRYSLQLYIIWAGSFVLAHTLIRRYRDSDLVEMVLTGVMVGLIVSVIISIYQLLAFRFGLPVNGITNAYTSAMGIDQRWAAFNLGGITHFRPYALFGEPKFMAAFAVACYAFLIFCHIVGKIGLRQFGFGVFCVVALAGMSASTSGVLSFFLVTVTGFFGRKTLRGLLVLLVIACLLGVIVDNYFIDLNEVYETRVTARLFAAEGPMELHELKYLESWTEDPVSFLFGRGYSGFSESAIGGIRLIPNSIIIYLGFSGGALLLFCYFLLFFRSVAHLRISLVFLSAGLVYVTSSTFFVLYFMAMVAMDYLRLQRHSIAANDSWPSRNSGIMKSPPFGMSSL